MSNHLLNFSEVSHLGDFCLPYRSRLAVLFQVPKHPFSRAAKYKARDFRETLCSSVQPSSIACCTQPAVSAPRDPCLPPHLGRVILRFRQFFPGLHSGNNFQAESHLDILLVSRSSGITLSNIYKELFHVSHVFFTGA